MTADQLTWRLATLNVLWRPEELNARLALLGRELRLLQPDVVCLQEVAAENEAELIALMNELGYTFHTPTNLMHTGKHWNLTFTKHPAVHEQLDMVVNGQPEGVIPTIVSVTKIGDKPVHILNAHFAWGSARAGYRLRQAEILNAYAQRKKFSTTIVIAGDLNTTPESAAIRYLTGLQEGSTGNGALWLDAWEACGADTGLAITNDPRDNTWARETCERHGLNPNMVPKRRIDYILTHEWKYGGPGAPMRFGLWADQPTVDGLFVSDHYGVWADIIL